jgi:hypothetical protein
MSLILKLKNKINEEKNKTISGYESLYNINPTHSSTSKIIIIVVKTSIIMLILIFLISTLFSNY